MPKRIFAAFIILLAVTSLACNMVSLIPSAATTGVKGVSVNPSKGSGTFAVKIDYTHRLGDPVQLVVCAAAGDEHTLQPSDDPGDQVLALPIWVVEPGKYTVTSSSKADDAYSAEFEVIVPEGEQEPKPEEYTDGGFKKHRPGEITSGGMWMLFDEGTSKPEGFPVPRQCLPGVNYTQAGGTSNLDVAPDGTLSGACSLSYYGGDQQLTGTLTGTWNGDTGEIVFHLETQTIYKASISKDGAQISGVSTTTTVYDGKGKITSEYQATGLATWVNDCSTTNPEAVVCYSREAPVWHIEGTVPWQINFNAPK